MAAYTHVTPYTCLSDKEAVKKPDPQMRNGSISYEDSGL